MATKKSITVNRAPVLTLWASVVAEHLGYDPEAALTLGKAVVGLNAQTKGRSLGIFKPPKSEEGTAPKKSVLGEEFWINLCGRSVPAKHTPNGVRAVVKDKPIDPEEVRRYLARAFGDNCSVVRKAVEQLAKSFEVDDLAERAFGLYEGFRPEVARGVGGWGQKGRLDLERIRGMKR